MSFIDFSASFGVLPLRSTVHRRTSRFSPQTIDRAPPTLLSAASVSLDQEISALKRSFEEAVQLYQQNLQSAPPLAQLDQRFADLEREQSEPNFWDNTKRVAYVNAELSTVTKLRSRLNQWQSWHDDAVVALDMLQETSDSEEQTMLLDELRDALTQLQTDCSAAALEWLLSGPYDQANARLLITAGAGGTEANDWVDMLYRMYERYCTRTFTSVRVLDRPPGDVTGSKAVEVLVTGPYAYGMLAGEKGAHRLVRISPYNAQNKRQTTFAGVDVMPELEEDAVVDVPVEDGDLEWSFFRSGGAGGQNQNKVSSGVRLVHKPSGITVRCTEERSQQLNRKVALTRLKAQLKVIAEQERLETVAQIRGDMVEARWGAQIRNYVLHPYKQVKDQRSGWEISDAEGFLNGEYLDDCIGAYLRHSRAKEQEEQTDPL